jgi:hypothetical protein
VDTIHVDVLQAGITGLPPELVYGVALGVAGSVVVAATFLLAERLLPERSSQRKRRTSGETRRRTEFREYLDAIDEQYAENHFVEGQHIAFYLPKRDVAITFDARAYYRILPTEIEPVLVEHEMPGSALGARLPFETPDLEFDEADESGIDPLKAACAELDIPVGASVEEIKQAYRRRIKEVHPDQGGDEDEFKRVREAYTLAKKHADQLPSNVAD